MSLPVWPSCLPLPQRNGYGLALGDANNMRDISGPVIARNRQTRQTAVVPVALVLTSLQFGIWESWFRHIIKEGASWFTCTLGGEADLQTYTVHMVGGYRAQMNGTAWTVAMQLLTDEPWKAA